jgi:hypothetical protein
MKLKELPQTIFQKHKDINFDVSKLYFDYEEKEIYDLLKQNILTADIFHHRIKVGPSNNMGWLNNSFSSVKSEEIGESYANFYYTLINSLSELEKQTLLDIALQQPNKFFARTLINNSDVKLTEEQFNTIFNSKEPRNFPLKEALIENKNIPLSDKQINEGLLVYGSGLNVLYAKRAGNQVSKETIDILINESNEDSCFNEDVLVELLKNQSTHFNKEQIQYCLDSDNFKLRAECARNYNLHFTEDQIKQGLKDEGFEYNGYDDTYEDYNEFDVVTAFMNNPNIILPKESIDEIIFGRDQEALLEELVEKKGLMLEDNQIDEIIAKKNRALALLLENESIHLNDNQLLKVVYYEPHWTKHVAKKYLARENVSVSELAMSVLKILPNEEIKKVIEEKGDKLLAGKKTPKMN